jgi:chorismate--pyruvate lyase
MLQPPNYLLPWLHYTDYLTHKLHAQSGNTQLQVLQEQWLAVTTPWDQTVLHLAPERVLHRDIVMLACNTPCWFARTILPETTYQSDLALFARLQHEPLGNLIFQGTAIQRVNLRHYPVDKDAAEYHWIPETCHAGQTPLWARMATFQLTAAPALFYLIEILLPGLERYSQ